MSRPTDFIPQTLRWQHVLGLVALAVCLKAMIMWLVLPVAAQYDIVPPTLGSAPDMYLQIARNIADGVGFRTIVSAVSAVARGPAYPYFLAALISIFGESTLAIQIANVALSLGTAIAVYFLSRRLTGVVHISLVCAAIAFFDPAMPLL